MIDRNKVLSQAADQCMKELYEYAQPRVEWDDFVKQCKEYSDKYYIWEAWSRAKHNKEKNPEDWATQSSLHPDWEGNINDCIGPRPYEFYYLPKDILKDIYDSYVDAYRIDRQQELLDTIDVLKGYFKEPIVEKWIPEERTDKDGNVIDCGHRGYVHPESLEDAIEKIIPNSEGVSEEVYEKVMEYMDMAANFYNYNRELNSFGVTIYLGVSPNSNKDAVIENWRKYKGKDIEINEEKMRKTYYGDEMDEFFGEEEEDDGTEV